FHGPAFQGVRALGSVGRDGIRGELEAGRAPGALLDNAGQLLGFWMMLSSDVDRLAMPVRIDRLRLFGPDPEPGERLACSVRVKRLGEREVVADLELARGGRLWARIEGWEDRRFETDARLWTVLREPEKHLLAEPRREGFVRL